MNEIRSRSLAVDLLKEELAEEGEQQETVSTAGPTRWDSVVKMLRSVDNARFAIAELQDKKLIPSALPVHSPAMHASITELVVCLF